jgi:hypothetical protein
MKAYRRIIIAVAVASAGLLVAACSSSSSTSQVMTGQDGGTQKKADAGHDATKDVGSVGAADVLPDAIIDPNNCVAPGAPFSQKGIGGYCSTGGGQCAHAGTGGTPTLCTADFGAPAHEWFCTITCTTTTDCGAGGGTCVAAPFGQFCVESACAKALGDAGEGAFDAGVDSGTPDSGTSADAKTDALEHDAGTHGDAHEDADKRDGAEDAPRDAAHG